MSVEDAAQQSDLLLNQDYVMPSSVINLFRRSALLDIDPGLLQTWVFNKSLEIAPHDYYFTIGETVGHIEAIVPDCGLSWIYTPPCVSLDHWPVKSPSEFAQFNSITHWSAEEWVDYNGHLFKNDKRSGYLPFLELPKLSTAPLELALFLDEGEDKERALLESYGWSVKHSHSLASTPDDYQNYIQGSLGEFSCVKPSCIKLQNAWISDRTLCYLASGKPAIVQHTGFSSFLPDRAGLLRFHDLKEAVSCLEEVISDYKKHSSLARALAEEYFDAKKVTKNFLEIAL